MKQRFNSFSDLSRHKKEGVHYTIVTREIAGSNIVIVAPHGGSIEWSTSRIAKDIAANDHNLYIFEGIEPSNAFFELHVTSHQFTEPRCIDLLSKNDVTLAIHGCRGDKPVVYLGGKDETLKSSLAAAFNAQGIKALTEGHVYKGISSQNICNKNRRGQGVQLEFSRGIRDNPELTDKCIAIIRTQLKAL